MPHSQKPISDLSSLSYRIMRHAQQGIRRFDFLREVVQIILDFSRCDAVELRTQGRSKWFICEGTAQQERVFRMETGSAEANDLSQNFASASPPLLEQIFLSVIRGQPDPSSPHFTAFGSYWHDNLDKEAIPPYRSIAIVPFTIDDVNKGSLLLKSFQQQYFTEQDVEFYEGLALTLGVAVANRRAQVALRERVKELTCLYGIARLIEQSELEMEQIIQGIVDLLPPAWLYPEVASSRIVLDGKVFVSGDCFQEGPQKQRAAIVAIGKQRGFVEVIYAQEMPELDEGPFLKEERNLVNAIAGDIAHLIERKQAEDEKSRLQNQLRHADRLATIGQLAAGVAH
ncbi:MAG: hypothetical protein ABH878_03765, partial [bacterium]